MTLKERQLIWADVREAWSGYIVYPKRRGRPSIATKIAKILGIKRRKPGRSMTLAGLDRPQREEAFWASVSNMNYMNEKGKHGSH